MIFARLGFASIFAIGVTASLLLLMYSLISQNLGDPGKPKKPQNFDINMVKEEIQTRRQFKKPEKPPQPMEPSRGAAT